MSLNIQDLGITEDIRQVITEVSQGKAYFFRQSSSEPNPFRYSGNPDLAYLGSLDLISFDDGSLLSRKKFKSSEDGIFNFKTGIPTFGIQEGDFCLLDFSQQTVEKEATVTKISYSISTIVSFEIDVKENVPSRLRDSIISD